MTQVLLYITPLLVLFMVEYASSFRCYKCASILNFNSNCSVGPVEEYEECTDYCFVDVYTAAGIRIHITRGCLEDTCSPSDACKLKSRIGRCKSCCTGDRCNYGSPDVDGAMRQQNCSNTLIFMLLSLSMLLTAMVR